MFSCIIVLVAIKITPIESEIISDLNWETQEKGVWLFHDLEAFPLLIRTNIETGGGSKTSKLEFAIDSIEQESFGSLQIGFRDTGLRYWLAGCPSSWIDMTDVPTSVEKVWNITKTATHIRMECNDVVVLDKLIASETSCSNIWGDKDVSYIMFDQADYATNAYNKIAGVYFVYSYVGWWCTFFNFVSIIYPLVCFLALHSL